MKDKKTELDEIVLKEHKEALDSSKLEAEPLDNHPAPFTDATKIKQLPVKNRILNWLSSNHKKVALAALGVAIVAASTVAFTDAKYAVRNIYTKADIRVAVIDASTSQPIPEAVVTINSKLARSDNKGVALISDVPYGRADIKAVKFAYGDATKKVKVTDNGQLVVVSLSPTGTPVSFRVTNTITGKVVKGAKASFGDSDAVSNEKGLVTLSIPPQLAETAEVTLSSTGMNPVKKTVVLADKKATEVKLTPAGKVYFLSKRTGKVDVMKSNLDGTEQQVVVQGTGKEDSRQTVMLASRDWKYLALKSKRDGDEKLFLIDTSNDRLSVIDEGKASFDPVGWSGSNFIYLINRENVPTWLPKNQSLKGFNAVSKKISLIDETEGEGSGNHAWRRQYIGSPYIVANGLVYIKFWSGPLSTDDKERQIIFAKVDGSQKKILKSVNNQNFNLLARLYAIDEVYFSSIPYRSYNPDAAKFYEYEDGVIKDADITSEQFSEFYATQLLSPTGNATVWSEPRDGKQTLLVGDGSGNNGKEIVALDEYIAYGWFSDNYVLVSKNNSELFIMPKSGPSEVGPIKITDYHKSNFNSRGYGYGYGGF